MSKNKISRILLSAKDKKGESSLVAEPAKEVRRNVSVACTECQKKKIVFPRLQYPSQLEGLTLGIGTAVFGAPMRGRSTQVGDPRTRDIAHAIRSSSSHFSEISEHVNQVLIPLCYGDI
ncbi:hypothetical protein N7478_009137 [Penicillium angulare]|uniref:uncharacterized protein n=1 Tax=Penicillium angulare TaxID=116970 RepID=UPI00253F84F7|nr:uncharacterized protein N7478_009137 [Penicillium angulare]KAJ5274012.1 hypothetical protein N7478_009137 [Penicillium angulare]